MSIAGAPIKPQTLLTPRPATLVATSARAATPAASLSRQARAERSASTDEFGVFAMKTALATAAIFGTFFAFLILLYASSRFGFALPFIQS